MHRLNVNAKLVLKHWLILLALLLTANPNFALRPARALPSGSELLLSNRCDEFAKTLPQTDSKNLDNSFSWAIDYALVLARLTISKRVECLKQLPPAWQQKILVHSVSMNGRKLDLQLVDAWRASGGDLNLARTETRNLATALVSTGHLMPLLYLQGLGLKPLHESDTANEIAAASMRLQQAWHTDFNGTSPAQPPIEWLLENGYSWPLETARAHELLSNLSRLTNPKLFESAFEYYEKKRIFTKIIDFDSKEPATPIIYSARSAKAVELLHKIGFNIYAQVIDKTSGKVLRSSALDVSGLPPDVQIALLDLKVSVKKGNDASIGSLYAVLSGSTIDLPLVERYLQAGAPLYVDTVSTQAGSGIRLQAMHYVAQLSPTSFKDGELEKLIQLLVKYGADPNFIQEGITADHRFGNLPIHTAIYQRLWGPFKGTPWKAGQPTFAVWLKESRIRPDVKHPHHKVSLLGYALKNSFFLPFNQIVSVINDLVAVGAPINPSGESLLLEPLKTDIKVDLQLISKLVELGANPNRVDSQTGLTVLTHLLTAKPYLTTDCRFWMPHHGRSRPECIYETREERLELIRWFVSRGANPGIKDRNGVSALDLADSFTDIEKRLSYRNALLLRTQ